MIFLEKYFKEIILNVGMQAYYKNYFEACPNYRLKK